MARRDQEQEGGIVLDDGTWVDVGADGRWRPSAGERARAGAILGVAMAALLLLALVLAVSGDGAEEDDAEVDVAASPPSSEPAETATTEAPIDPSSVGGEPASPDCVADDRDAAPLRDRDEAVVLVLNATSRAGHAGDVSTLLEGIGYRAAVPDNGGRREVTSVAFLAGWCAEAEQVRADLALPEATVEPMPEDLLDIVGRARIVVSLGADSL